MIYIGSVRGISILCCFFSFALIVFVSDYFFGDIR